MLLGGLHKLAGITANAFIKNKNEFMRRDCEMVSKKLKIDFKFNDYFPISSLNLMRGSLVTIKIYQISISIVFLMHIGETI